MDFEKTISLKYPGFKYAISKNIDYNNCCGGICDNYILVLFDKNFNPCEKNNDLDTEDSNHYIKIFRFWKNCISREDGYFYMKGFDSCEEAEFFLKKRLNIMSVENDLDYYNLKKFS